MKTAKESGVCNVDGNYESQNSTIFNEIFEYDVIIWAAIPKNGEWKLKDSWNTKLNC